MVNFNPNEHRLAEIKALNREINRYFVEKKFNRVKSFATSAAQNLWEAVRVARDLNPEEIPTDLTLEGVPVPPGEVANSFAKHFSEKNQTECQQG